MADTIDLARISIREVATAQLTAGELQALRDLLWAAFGSKHPDEGMTEADWQHGLGGIHFVAYSGGSIVGHASVVERELHVGERPLRTGYVEAVAIRVGWQRAGIGTLLMRRVNEHIARNFEIGALGTSVFGFYTPLGWRAWRGPSSVRTAAGLSPTPDEDGYIMVLPTPSSPELDLTDPISCDWREGDVW